MNIATDDRTAEVGMTLTDVDKRSRLLFNALSFRPELLAFVSVVRLTWGRMPIPYPIPSKPFIFFWIVTG